MNILSYSKALYTTWVYYSPDRTLFDSGECVATMLNNKVYAIKNIFLTHGHVDHISGLWALINTRNNAMGDRAKELNVYYPKNNKGIEDYIKFIKRVNSDLRFKLNFFPITPDDKIILRGKKRIEKYIRPFFVTHTQSEISFGYHIIEVRRKLKEEFRNLSQEEIAVLAKKYGSEYITRSYEKKVFTISGDTFLLSREEVKDSEIVFHECTFLDKRDRKYKNHASIEDIVSLIEGSNIKTLILYHISSRYGRSIEKLLEPYRNRLKEEGVDLYFVKPDRLFKL
ncbi:MBL fold metallo-hydrolase [Thermosipho ferrireducens]|uniref:MBL fold metallo-hydrolase n=1 Tax=Thermosipho ferrireducens TaxID=2571116 RepID=A0ABX7S5N1_9BACT|nr:MBL fold metallo-hydrolase [Thermosipho ferrireducens]QTA37852.1 MBL fold metallo-hydrolase [Thermosipho ferrireducens]